MLKFKNCHISLLNFLHLFLFNKNIQNFINFLLKFADNK